MNIPAIDPELKEALRRNEEIVEQLGPAEPGLAGVRSKAAAARAWWNDGGPALAERRLASIRGPYRDIPLVLYRPTTTGRLPVYVYLHGGGYRLGNEQWNDRQMRELASLWGGAVISLDYAHVPEHVFPRAIEEVQAGLEWIHKAGSDWGLDGDRVAFGGSSAGANVAVGAAIGLGGVKTGYLRAGATMAGIFDHDFKTESMQIYGDSGVVPTARGVEELLSAYLPEASRDDPRANLLHADASLCPAMFLAAAEIDTLRDSSVLMAQRLAQAGVECELKVYPGMTHMFFGFSRMVKTAQTCVADLAGFLHRHLPVRTDSARA